MRYLQHVVLIMAVVMLAGCAKKGRTADTISDGKSWIETDDPTIDYDVYVCWVRREYSDGASKTIWVYNGRVVGHGREGMARLISELRRLPEGRRVLFFPMYSVWDHEMWNVYPDPVTSEIYSVIEQCKLWSVNLGDVPSRLKVYTGPFRETPQDKLPMSAPTTPGTLPSTSTSTP